MLRRLAGPLWALLCIACLGGIALAPAHAQKNATLAPQHADGAAPHGPKRYVLLPGGIARDKTTQLEWLRCALGQTWDGKTCQGNGVQYTFAAAGQAVEDFNRRHGLLGRSAWLIPSHRQLFSLVYCAQGTQKVAVDLRDGAAPIGAACRVDGKGGPTLVQSVFPNTPGGVGPWFWSSSPQVDVADHAWFIQFFSGHLHAVYRDNPYYLYLARPAQRP